MKIFSNKKRLLDLFLTALSLIVLISLNRIYLMLNFTEAEVLHAIQDLRQDKAPGPDGFHIMFFSPEMLEFHQS